MTIFKQAHSHMNLFRIFFISISLVTAHPFMHADVVHNDGFNSDTVPWKSPQPGGALSRSTDSPTNLSCMGYDLIDDTTLVAQCFKTPDGPRSFIAFDTTTLKIKDQLKDVEFQCLCHPTNPCYCVASGYYWHINDKMEMVVPLSDKLLYIQWDKMRQQLEITQEISLTSHLQPLEYVQQIRPDWMNGDLWISTDKGRIGLMHTKNMEIQWIQLQGPILKNLMVDPDGVHVLTDYGLWFLTASSGIMWHHEYDRGTTIKPGMYGLGSCTSPTKIGNLVVFCDNRDEQIQLLSLNNQGHVQCQVPVFQPRKSAVCFSVIALDPFAIVTNTYGFPTPLGSRDDVIPEPGFAKVNVVTCEKVWETYERINVGGIAYASVADDLFFGFFGQWTLEQHKQPYPGVFYDGNWSFGVFSADTGQLVHEVDLPDGPAFMPHASNPKAYQDMVLWFSLNGHLFKYVW